MPYKSEAQRRKFHQLLKEGKISKNTVNEFDKASKGVKLPQKLSRPRTIREMVDVANKKIKK